jgi:hypothetical protein
LGVFLNKEKKTSSSRFFGRFLSLRLSLSKSDLRDSQIGCPHPLALSSKSRHLRSRMKVE